MDHEEYRIFISATTDEFGETRGKIASDLRARDLTVKEQQEFTQTSAATTLAKLHNYICTCSAVVSIIGLKTGSFPPADNTKSYEQMLPPGISQASYTQWEVLFALHYKKRISIHIARAAAEQGEPTQKKFVAYLEDKGLDRSYFSRPEDVQLAVLRETWPDFNPLRGEWTEHEEPAAAIASVSDGINVKNCPYLGPRSFTSRAEDLELFFGRDRETKEILERLIAPNAKRGLLPIYAPSGTGKTSLINTKVRSKLEEAGFAVWLDVRVGALPRVPFPENVGNVFTFLTACTRYPLGTADGEYLKHSGDRLRNVVEQWQAAVRKEKQPRGWVIFFDQFEEIFFDQGDGQYRPELRASHRDDFFDELQTVARDFPDVRIVLLLRKEYMYDLRLALKDPDGEIADYLLQRFGPRAAMEAVVQPAAKRGVSFHKEAAQSIVKGLSRENKLNPTGDVLNNSDEFIEPVYLSVVCYQLWHKIAAINSSNVVKDIDVDLMRRVYGRDGDTRAVVLGALESWYQDLVADVAKAEQAVRGRYSSDKICHEMLKFISVGEGDEGTRVKVPLGRRQSGPFPRWLIKMLVNKWLLRWADGGWYELTHDRLIAPVRKAAKIDEAGRRQLAITEKIAFQIKDEPTLDGKFVEQRQINDLAWEFVPKRDQTTGRFNENLLFSCDELEFIFRSTIAEGDETRIKRWTEFLSQALNERLPEIIRDALKATIGKPTQTPAIRSGAARAVGYIPAPLCADEKSQVANLALVDTESEVRYAAAISIARIDAPELYDLWAQTFAAAGGLDRGRMLRSFAHAMNERSLEEDTTNFSENCFSRLNLLQRAGVYGRLFAIRFVTGIHKFLYVVPLCAFGAALFTCLVRWVPAMWYYTWTQELPPWQWGPGRKQPIAFNSFAAIEGTFQAICGGVSWGITISIAIAIAWIVFIRGCPGKTLSRRMGTLAAGLLGGLAGGLMLNLLILPVYKGNSLLDNGWVKDNTQMPRDSMLARLSDTWPTRAPLIYPIYGLFLGIGCAWTVLSLRSGQSEVEWEKLVTTGEKKRVKELFWRTIARSWRVAICMALAATVLCFVVKTSNLSKLHTTIMRTFCDAGSIVVGGAGFSVAMMYGFMLIRVGFRVRPQSD